MAPDTSPGRRRRIRGVVEGNPLGRALIARRDRKALIDLIVRAGFVDLAWYEAATGRSFGSRCDAAAHYLATSGPEPLNPLIAGSVMDAARDGDEPRVVEDDHMVRYLLRGNLRYLPTPVFDDHVYLEGQPDAAGHPGRARGHFLSTARSETPLPVPVSWRAPAPTWGEWRARMLENAAVLRSREMGTAPREIDWTTLTAGLGERVGGRVSVLIPTVGDWRLTDAAIGALLRHSESHDLEVVITDNGSGYAHALGLAQSVAARDPAGGAITVVWLGVNANFAGGTNIAFERSTGGNIVLLNNDTEVQPGWLDPLMEELEDPTVLGVQPLLLYGDGTVQTAGTGFPECGGLPSHLLVAHPPEDARRLGRFDVSAVTAAAMAMRAGDYCRLRGLDEGFANGYEDVDLCLRAGTEGSGWFRVATDSVVVHFESRTRAREVVESNRDRLWNRWRDQLPRGDTARILREAGFAVIRWDPGIVGRAGLGRIPAPVIVRLGADANRSRDEQVTCLRWAIKLPVAFANGEGLRDPGPEPLLTVGEALRLALERQGQQVVVDYLESHQRPTAGLDDVVLVIGPVVEPFEPHPGRPNLTWNLPSTIPDPFEAGAWDEIARTLTSSAERWREFNSRRMGISPSS